MFSIPEESEVNSPERLKELFIQAAHKGTKSLHEIEFGPKFQINLSKFKNDLPPRPPKDNRNTKALIRHIDEYIGHKHESDSDSLTS
mgnify:CR=1 FL=1